MQKGTIGVQTTNIFPIIKQFLYSDHEIFLRELVSNAVDATQKLKTLNANGEFQGNCEDLKVSVHIDSEKKILTISDRGIGMTEEDVEKYINQIAFSGAEEFINKYKDSTNAIIGHFGLGFYSAFMVADKVEIQTLSYRDGAKAVKWSCDGSPEYEMTEGSRTERGTDIIVYISDEYKEYLEQNKIESLLRKYCKFLPVSIVFGKEQEWKDGKYVDTDKDKVINNVAPLWTRTPSELKDEDYLSFYQAINPSGEEPLFWIHLNVDYPFTLTGILYFPKIKNNLEIRKDQIQLYCNQVFVTDSVKGVVPEFMELLQGVIDSPDIPLNVSRSYLQSDRNVKKISTYITKKVAQKLEEISKNAPSDFDKKWNDIKLFIEFGMLSDEKFCESALKFARLQNTENKFFNLEDYKKLIEAEQTDKDGNLIYLYATDREAQYSYIKTAKERGYDVLLFDGQLDVPLAGLLEQKQEKSRFVRVDSDVIDRLIIKQEAKAIELSLDQQNLLTDLFTTQLPSLEKGNMVVSLASLSSEAAAVTITQSEYMRRMKEMAKFQPGMSYFGEMPNSYNFTLNVNHKVVKKILDDASAAMSAQLEPVSQNINRLEQELNTQEAVKKEDANYDQAQKQITQLREQIQNAKSERREVISKYAVEQPKVKQLIDIALLGNGLLTGENLANFLKRSVDLL